MIEPGIRDDDFTVAFGKNITITGTHAAEDGALLIQVASHEPPPTGRVRIVMDGNVVYDGDPDTGRDYLKEAGL